MNVNYIPIINYYTYSNSMHKINLLGFAHLNCCHVSNTRRILCVITKREERTAKAEPRVNQPIKCQFVKNVRN